jgi:hypothetical protein
MLEDKSDVKNIELTECVNILMDNINEEMDNLDNQEEELIRFKLLMEGTIRDESDVMIKQVKSVETKKSMQKRPILSKAVKK